MSTLGDLTPNMVGLVTLTIALPDVTISGRLTEFKYTPDTYYGAGVEVSIGRIPLPELPRHVPCLIREHDARGD